MLPWGGILANYGKQKGIQYLNSNTGYMGTLLSILTSKNPVQTAKGAAEGYAVNKGLGYAANQIGGNSALNNMNAGGGWSGFSNMLGTVAGNYLAGPAQDTGEATGRQIGGMVGSAFIPYVGGLLGTGIGGALGELASGGEKQRNGSLEFSANPIIKGALGDTNVYGRGQDVFGNFGLTDEQNFGHKWDQTYNNFAANLSASDNFVAQHLNMSPQQTQEAGQYLQNLNGQSYLLGNNRDNGLNINGNDRLLVDHYAGILSAINPSLGNLMQTYTGGISDLNKTLASNMSLASNYISGKASQQDINNALQQGYNNMFTNTATANTIGSVGQGTKSTPQIPRNANGDFSFVSNQGMGTDTARWNPETNQVEIGHYNTVQSENGPDQTTWVPGSVNNMGNLATYNNSTLKNSGALQNNQGANFGQYALQQWENSPEFQTWKQQQIASQNANPTSGQPLGSISGMGH